MIGAGLQLPCPPLAIIVHPGMEAQRTAPMGRERNGIPLVARKPAYFVVYDPLAPTSPTYAPFVDASKIEYGAFGTLPHLLDRDFIPALRALWFCLHLPATC